MQAQTLLVLSPFHVFFGLFFCPFSSLSRLCEMTDAIEPVAVPSKLAFFLLAGESGLKPVDLYFVKFVFTI